MSIKKETLKILKNQQGIGVIVIFLITIPILILMCIATLGIGYTIESSDMDLQESVAEASKAAAGCVDEVSQAKGELKINTPRANEIFKNSLVANLGLDENMECTTGKYVGKLQYTLLVYNSVAPGDDKGELVNQVYMYHDNTEGNYPIYFAIFPKYFRINGLNINVAPYMEETKGDIELDSPGVIAIVQVKQKDVVTGEEEEITRWASAKVHKWNAD